MKIVFQMFEWIYFSWEKNKPKKPKIIPPQMKIPEDTNKSSKIVYMKNQYGVPKESVRRNTLGNLLY